MCGVFNFFLSVFLLNSVRGVGVALLHFTVGLFGRFVWVGFGDEFS
jgi:hypothetical protein